MNASVGTTIKHSRGTRGNIEIHWDQCAASRLSVPYVAEGRQSVTGRHDIVLVDRPCNKIAKDEKRDQQPPDVQ